MRLIRVMCSGRVDLEFIFRAFANRQDGVFIGGCRLNECNYVTHGNYDALSNVYLGRKLLGYIGVNPERLHIEFMSGAEGNLLAEATDTFSGKIKALGPLGKDEGLDEHQMTLRLNAVRRLVPYIKLVERERLRVPVKSAQAYQAFFHSSATDRLFGELIRDKLTLSQILSLLKEKPLSTKDISARLQLNPSEVAKHMNDASRQGLVRYVEDRKSYTLAVT